MTSHITTCIICKHSLHATPNDKPNIKLSCECTFHNKCIKTFIHNVEPSAYICPLCKKPISHSISDTFGFMYDETPEKYLDVAKLNSLVKFNDIEAHGSKIVIDGYTYTNLEQQLLNYYEVDAISFQYGSIDNSQDLTTITDSASNIYNSINLYLLKSDEDSNKFILVDEYIRQLSFCKKITASDIYEDEDELGNKYYSTSEEFPIRKYVKYVPLSVMMQFTLYVQMLNLPYFTHENIDKMSMPLLDPNDEEIKIINCFCSFMINVSFNSLKLYTEQNVQLNIDDTKIIKLFSIASIFNCLHP